jgi:hypothetical protein
MTELPNNELPNNLTAEDAEWLGKILDSVKVRNAKTVTITISQKDAEELAFGTNSNGYGPYDMAIENVSNACENALDKI